MYSTTCFYYCIKKNKAKNCKKGVDRRGAEVHKPSSPLRDGSSSYKSAGLRGRLLSDKAVVFLLSENKLLTGCSGWGRIERRFKLP